MGNAFNGVSDARLTKAELEMAYFANMRSDQLQIRDIDINDTLAELQSEYNTQYDQTME